MRMPNWAGTLERLPIQGFLVVGLLLLAAPIAGFGAGFGVYPFGNNGKLKMLYDARQRPQSVLLHGRLHIVFNADARPTKNLRASAVPMGVTFDLEGRTFSDPVALGPRHTDHHFSPIIWADERDHLHVLHGCHRTPGQHLVSVEPVRNGSLRIQWEVMGDIAPKLSYPTVYRISGNREIIYYRTDGHTSSWTYRISDDNGRTWVGPTQDVTDLDAGGRLDWSSYQTKIPSRDGRFLHVVYTDYDDNKHRPDPKRFFNPRYRREVGNEWKYNLSYFKIDLESQRVSNAANQAVQTPIDFDRSEKHCQIWDTQWRGAGVPPAIALSPGGEPSFLHVLSEDTIQSHRYYYVAREGGGWFQTPICRSSHQWNSGHLRHDDDGSLHAFVVAGEHYLNGGYMDRHGGGRIEEWVSRDRGRSWSKRRTLSPDGERFAGWRFNNVQPVLHPDGTEVRGMLLFYGWRDADAPTAKAFLVVDEAPSRSR